MDKIYIQIASYRDQHLLKTIDSAIDNAAVADRLTFGICWQHDDTEDMSKYIDDDRFTIIDVPHNESKGCCWARNQTNLAYNNEKYMLQIDAHTRFGENWDIDLINMLNSIDYDKPLITTYPPGFIVHDDGTEEKLTMVGVQRLILEKFNHDYTTRQKCEPVPDLDKPGKSRFIAAGMIFTYGEFCREVEYDPKLYFSGEEINLAARAFTNGYRFFYPNKNVLWHLYDHPSPLHWTDNSSTQTKSHEVAVERLENLFIGDQSKVGKYKLGDHSSLAEFEDYAEISFAERKEINDNKGKNKVHYKYELNLNTDWIPDTKDYEVWVFAIEDEDSVEIWRGDIVDEEILNKEKSTVDIDIDVNDIPDTYILWPKRKDDTWLDKKTFKLPDVESHLLKNET